jgi:hypothetical protein
MYDGASTVAILRNRYSHVRGSRCTAPPTSFPCWYQDAVATFALVPIECIGGSLPRTQPRLVEAWAEIHHAELLDDWRRLQSGQPPLKIEPLR